MIGTSFGPYRIEDVLGRGGMGEVYRAADTSQDDRIVALKVLSPTLSTDPVFVERFRREAQVAARLTDPHIVPVHRFGEIGGRLFLDMQLIEGPELADVVTVDGPLAPARAVAIVEQVADALDAAHAAGLVHRDVKPSNVLLTDQGNGRAEVAYLVDFGIAGAAGPSSQTALTRTGTLVGTLGYMAPERFLARPATPAADVYALACLLHVLLTGELPYRGTDYSAQIDGHLNGPLPRPSSLRPSLPGAFDAVVGWGMAKDPGSRPPTAGALAATARAALASDPARPGEPMRQARTAHPIPAHPMPAHPMPVGAPPPAAGTGWWVAGLGAAVVLLMLATVVVVNTVTRQRPVSDSAVAPPTSTLATGAVPSSVPITERVLVGHAPSIFPPTLARLAGRPVLVVRGAAEDVVVLDPATGEPIGQPVPSRSVTSATVATIEGRSTVVTGGSDQIIRMWDLETGKALPTALAGHTALVAAVAVVEVDGAPLLVSAGDDLTVRTWNLATGTPVGAPLVTLPAEVRDLAMVSSGDRPVILTNTRDSVTRAWDLRTGQPVGRPIPTPNTQATTVELGTGSAVLATRGGDLAVHDLATGTEVARGQVGHVEALGIAVVGGRLVAIIAQDHVIHLVDPATGARVGGPMAGHEAWVSSFATVDDGGATFLISTSSHDHSIRIWNLTERARAR